MTAESRHGHRSVDDHFRGSGPDQLITAESRHSTRSDTTITTVIPPPIDLLITVGSRHETRNSVAVVGASVWDGGFVTFASPVGGDDVDMALDEWGVFAGGLTDAQMADLPGRARHHRVFGGYVFGVVDHTDPGPADQHVYDLSLAGYGLRLDKTFVRQLYASATGSSVREIAADVLSVAGLDGVFNTHGVTLNDIVDRAVYPVLGVMDILRQLADEHGAIVTVDSWREIDMVRETALTHSPLRLYRTGKVGNLRSLGRSTEPRHYANRSIVVGRGETGTIQDERTGDGATRQWDLSQVPEEVIEVSLDGVDEAFEGTGALWEVDQDAATITRTTGASTPGVGATLKVTYVSREAIVITTDDAAAITDIGFTVARKLEDDAIDTPGLARVRGGAFLDRHNELSEHYVAETIPGAVKHVVAGVAPTCDFPRYGVNGGRLLIEAVSSALGRSGDRFHAIVHKIKLTAQDYQGDAGDDWRQYQLTRPPAPRPQVPGTVDPNQEIIRPDNVAVPASLPIHLGGSPAVLINSSTWTIPDGAVIERVSGHQIPIPLAFQLMARCVSPRGHARGRRDDDRPAVGLDEQPAHRLRHRGRPHGRRPLHPAGDHPAAAGVRRDVAGAGARRAPRRSGVGRPVEARYLKDHGT